MKELQDIRMTMYRAKALEKMCENVLQNACLHNDETFELGTGNDKVRLVAAIEAARGVLTHQKQKNLRKKWDLWAQENHLPKLAGLAEQDAKRSDANDDRIGKMIQAWKPNS